MINRINDQIILQTKLHRPRVTADLVHRPRLKALLNDGLDQPLILVAAPAGFGKSTLLTAWLETCSRPNAWISLSEADNDLGVFLAYFLGAIETLFPGSLPETQSFLTSVTLPAVPVIAGSLINELDELGGDFILVLDDYQLIHELSIHELLDSLLQYPPPGMHLVIASRQDPLLSLTMLRARHQIAEIRGQDLRFSKAEIADFVQRTTGLSLAADALDVLADKTEGWATGLRLAALSFRYSADKEKDFTRLHAENRYVTDYLLSEVLSKVSPSMRNFLLKSSILDQVCAPLGEALIGADDPECEPQAYLDWLEQAQMFTVALDAQGEWYRYHHLFQELLREQLAREAGPTEIDALHARASAWYNSQGALEESLHHALLGHDIPAAVRLIAEQRHALMNAEQWQLQDRILHMFPAEAVTSYPDLLLMTAEITTLKRTGWAHFMALLDQAEGLLAQMADQPERAAQLQGEIDALRSLYSYETATDPESAIAFAQRSLAATPRAWYYVRAYAWLYLAAAYQAVGQLDHAYAVLAKGQQEDVTQNGAVHARLVGSRCFVAWMAGDLPAVAQGAARLRTVSERHKRYESLVWAHYLLCSAAYERNDLAAAEKHALAVEKMRYLGRPMAYLQSAFIYASIYQARGQAGQARRKISMAFAFLNETHSEGLAPLAQAFQAELALMRDDLDTTRHWATTIGPFLPLTFLPYFHIPQLTLPKILLAQETADSREQADALLYELRTFITASHNTRATLQVLALQAMLYDAQGAEPAALAHLQQALSLAEPGGSIRLFVDLGPRLASLLRRLEPVGVDVGYINQILNAFGRPTAADPHRSDSDSATREMAWIEQLTKREHEILLLLGQRLTDKEIAQMLFISHLTVKRHAATIYQKLHVTGRREAVVEAIRLGLL